MDKSVHFVQLFELVVPFQEVLKLMARNISDSEIRFVLAMNRAQATINTNEQKSLALLNLVVWLCMYL